MSRATSEPSGTAGRRTPVGRQIQWAVLVSVALLIVVGVWTARLHHEPVRPDGLTGKLVYHGTTRVRDGTTVTVVLGKRSFDPTYLEAAAGARITVHLRAEGFRAHTFTVPSLGIDVTVAPGGVADVPLTVPAGGAALFFCRFHRSQGMQGAIVQQH